MHEVELLTDGAGRVVYGVKRFNGRITHAIPVDTTVMDGFEDVYPELAKPEARHTPTVLKVRKLDSAGKLRPAVVSARLDPETGEPVPDGMERGV